MNRDRKVHGVCLLPLNSGSEFSTELLIVMPHPHPPQWTHWFSSKIENESLRDVGFFVRVLIPPGERMGGWVRRDRPPPSFWVTPSRSFVQKMLRKFCSDPFDGWAGVEPPPKEGLFKKGSWRGWCHLCAFPSDREPLAPRLGRRLGGTVDLSSLRRERHCAPAPLIDPSFSPGIRPGIRYRESLPKKWCNKTPSQI